METLLWQAQQQSGRLTDWRREIHSHPETGMDTRRTAAFVRGELRAMGCRADFIGQNGVLAQLGEPAGGCVLLRADLDALPVAEESGLPFAAHNGCAHACGHDLHAAMLLGAAALLRAREASLPGCVKLLFQPGEETLGGAKAMLEAGALEAPQAEAAAMLHVMSGLPLPAGTVLVPRGGAVCAASDWFEIRVTGRAGHGAMPDRAVDPLLAASYIHLALQELNSRELAPGSFAAVTVGRAGGGTVANAIPETAELAGTVRTFDAGVRAHIRERLPQIAADIARALRAGADVVWTRECPALHCDETLAQAVFGALGDAGVSARRTDDRGGSDDFAHIAARVPSVLLLVSAGAPGEAGARPLHHPGVVFDEAALPAGAAAYAAAALGMLSALRKAAGATA